MVLDIFNRRPGGLNDIQNRIEFRESGQGDPP